MSDRQGPGRTKGIQGYGQAIARNRSLDLRDVRQHDRTDEKTGSISLCAGLVGLDTTDAAAHENAAVNLPVEKLDQLLIINNLYY